MLVGQVGLVPIQPRPVWVRAIRSRDAAKQSLNCWHFCDMQDRWRQPGSGWQWAVAVLDLCSVFDCEGSWFESVWDGEEWEGLY